ncbi:MAG: TonB-dependent siderophore receptor [Rudaea sp.]|uniref:TonB-dependent siderophore receptor n=1 Tax=Rudaea sp. TaxID=2136325 RepID=UPI0039E53129
MLSRKPLAYSIAVLLLANTVTVAEETVSGAESAQPADAQTEKKTQDFDTITVEQKFTKADAKSAMKMDVAVMDTPFSVQSYSEELIKSLEAYTLADVFGHMTGVKLAGQTGMDMTLRGFQSSGTDMNAILVDGLPGLSERFSSPPTVSLDRIELVRGAMSVLYGQNQPGGFLNLVTKKPQFDPVYDFGVSTSGYAGHGLGIGDDPSYHFDFDTAGHIDSEGLFNYRFLGEFNDNHNFRDFNYDRSRYLAPSVAWNINESTQLLAQVEYRKDKGRIDTYLVAPGWNVANVAPINTYYGEPGTNRLEEGTTATLQFNHTFANNWVWNAAYRYVDYSTEQTDFSAVNVLADGVTLQRRARALNTARSNKTFDTNLAIPLETGPISQKIVVGTTIEDYSINNNRSKFYNSTCPGAYCFNINVYNPVYYRVPQWDTIPAGPATSLTNNINKDTTTAFYVSDLISIGERWKVSLGARNFKDDSTAVSINPPAPDYNKTLKKSLLPMAGVLFQPNKNWTLYASYSESYVPVDPTYFDINGKSPFAPTEGKQYEAGVKSDKLLDGRLTATLAVYRIEQTGIMQSYSCAAYGQCWIQVGAAQSDGLEFETNFAVTKQWQLIFGYAHDNARVTASNQPIQIGKKLQNAPDDSANLWSRYNFDNGFSIGAGFVYNSSYAGNTPSNQAPLLIHMPGYTVADMDLAYEHDNYTINLKLNNLFDRTYYPATGSTPQVMIIPGAPRSFTLSFRAKF